MWDLLGRVGQADFKSAFWPRENSERRVALGFRSLEAREVWTAVSGR